MKAELRLETMREIVERATLAPSSHNTQPWLFELADRHIRLIADRTRALPVNDPHDRELTISCGCALFNLRLAAQDAGFAPATRIFPQPDDEDVLAAVELRTEHHDADELTELAPAIEARRTHRRKFERREVPDRLADSLRRAVEAEGAWLRVLTDKDVRHAVAQLVEAGDEAQWSDASWRRELAAWMHPRRTGDGLTVPGLIAPLARSVVRTFDMGGLVGGRDEDLAEDAPLLIVLGTGEDGAEAWLSAGQALQRLLLTACSQGLQASYLNQAIQTSSLRPELQQAIGEERPPQLLLRLGYPADDLPPTPRRDIGDVLLSS